MTDHVMVPTPTPDSREAQAGSPDANVEAIRTRLLERSRAGLAKYGVTTERTDLTVAQWLRHAQEEAMDLAVYLECCIAHVANLTEERGQLADTVKFEQRNLAHLHERYGEVLAELTTLRAERERLREAFAKLQASMT